MPSNLHRPVILILKMRTNNDQVIRGKHSPGDLQELLTGTGREAIEEKKSKCKSWNHDRKAKGTFCQNDGLLQMITETPGQPKRRSIPYSNPAVERTIEAKPKRERVHQKIKTSLPQISAAILIYKVFSISRHTSFLKPYGYPRLRSHHRRNFR